MEPARGREPAKFSTREMIDTERGMVDSAERLAQAGRHGVSSPITNAAIDGAGTLSAEQQNAVRHVLKPGSLAVIIGAARSEERSVGKGVVSPCRSRWSPCT